jgi:hypothetical protein
MDNKKRFQLLNALLGTLVLVALLAACYPRDIYPDFSKDTHPIVFQLWGAEGEKSGGLGLINADGTGIKTFPNNLISRMPAWSPDGKRILVLYPWGSFDYGYLGIINQGTFCKDKGVFFERLRWGSDRDILRENIEYPEGAPYVREIVLWNIDTCSISKVLYREATTELFKYFDYSAKGDVAFTREIKQSRMVAVYRSEKDLLSIIGVGFGATWSPDGTQFVFTGSDGLYISDAEGKSIQKTVDLTAHYALKDGAIQWDDWPPMAVWSPDGRFLLYHRPNNGTYELVKFEIATRTETVIYRGGMYPDWR